MQDIAEALNQAVDAKGENAITLTTHGAKYFYTLQKQNMNVDIDFKKHNIHIKFFDVIIHFYGDMIEIIVEDQSIGFDLKGKKEKAGVFDLKNKKQNKIKYEEVEIDLKQELIAKEGETKCKELGFTRAKQFKNYIIAIDHENSFICFENDVYLVMAYRMQKKIVFEACHFESNTREHFIIIDENLTRKIQWENILEVKHEREHVTKAKRMWRRLWHFFI